MDGAPHCSGSLRPRSMSMRRGTPRPRRSPTPMPNALDLAAALAFSRYATAALAARPDERESLRATIDAPFDWARGACGARRDASTRGDPHGARRTRAPAAPAGLRAHAGARSDRARGPAEVCADMTTLAETALRSAVALHHRALAADFGEPRDENGAAQQLVIVGMGKLGGGELNVSSDIDLVFVYPEDGETAGARPLANHEFFERLGRRVIAALHEMTPEGLRVPRRHAAAALRRQRAARRALSRRSSTIWSRRAARGSATRGSRRARSPARGTTSSTALVTPFVFRKYLDFDAYDGLRDVHRQIARAGPAPRLRAEHQARPGGIREIEFIVQALQLVRGGREPALRVARHAARARRARRARPAAGDGGRRAARRVRVPAQPRASAAVPRRPADADAAAGAGGARGARRSAMGFADVAIVRRALAAHRAAVAEQFATSSARTAHAATMPTSGRALATGASPTPSFAAALARRRRHRRRRSERSRTRASPIPPALLAHLAARSRERRATCSCRRCRASASTRSCRSCSRRAAAAPNAAPTRRRCSMRLLELLEAVSRRSAYLALLIEHPPLLPRLAHLMGASRGRPTT